MEYEEYNYAIANENGLYYRGTAYGDDRDWTTETRGWCDGAYTYSLNGAWRKICAFPEMFDKCEVIRL
jgi:hypothetical protein